MDSARKVELLQQQIAEARNGHPEDFSLWRQKTDVVLRACLGDASPLYVSFSAIRYTLSMWTSSTPESAWIQAQASGVLEAVALLQAAKLEVELTGGSPQRAGDGAAPSAGKTVFIVHGHDEARKHEVARFVQDLTSNKPVILHEQASSGGTVIEKFETYAADAGYAVVIATGDDVGRASTGPPEDDRPRARQNVVFELGFFFAALGRPRVALLHEEEVEVPSDIAGLVRITLDPGGAWKLALARELDGARIPIDWSALR